MKLPRDALPAAGSRGASSVCGAPSGSHGQSDSSKEQKNEQLGTFGSDACPALGSHSFSTQTAPWCCDPSPQEEQPHTTEYSSWASSRSLLLSYFPSTPTALILQEVSHREAKRPGAKIVQWEEQDWVSWSRPPHLPPTLAPDTHRAAGR